MRKLSTFLSILLLFTLHIASAQITVNTTTNTLDELVNDVLINSTCANATNVMTPNNSEVGGNTFRSYGYFNRGTSNFPFEEGVVLTTSDINQIPGPNDSDLSLGGTAWTGDADIAALLQIPVGQTFNATVIEFEFTPTTDRLSFRYLLASEEYTQNFPCSFADGFAFILSGPGIPTTNNYNHDADPATPDISVDLGGQNIALVPGTNIPVSITNIHNLTTCGAGQLGSVALPEFFDAVLSGTGATDFNGQTVVLTAESDVTPNATYTIKLVIAENTDASFDSGIFIEAGSFNIGGSLGADRVLATQTAGCTGETIVLDPMVTEPTATYKWFKDAVELTGETGTTLSVTDAGLYSVEVIIPGGCDINDEITIEFAENPAIAATPADILQCDDDNDGLWNFDFTVLDATILGTQSDADFNVSYHASQADADTNTAPLANPYTNQIAYTQETIFVRLENATASNCFVTTSFIIDVFDQPTANAVANYELCDDDTDGDATNGFVVFDLNTIDNQVLGTQTAAQFNITYHANQTDADGDMNPLATSYTNTTAGGNPVVARIENVDNPDCFSTITFNTVVNQLPMIAANPDNILQCDDDNDGFWNFDFTTLNGSILGTQTAANFTISYHTSQADADANNAPLTFPYTNQIAYGLETIYVRIENNTANDCFDTTSFDIDVFDQPTANIVANYELCDDATDGDDTNGFTTFNFSTLDIQVLGVQDMMQFNVSYYANQADANDSMNILPTNYVNTTAGGNQIIARIENVDNPNCFDTIEINVVVNPLPVITTPVSLRQCDDDTDGFTNFNLTEANVLLSADSANETFTYYTNLVDATANTNAIADPTVYNSANNGQVFVRVETVNGCSRIGEINLEVATTQIPSTFQLSYELCDTDLVDNDYRNGITTFDFSDANAQITALFPAGQNLTITYYENIADALAELNAIADISNHRNDASPNVQTIVVRVDSDDINACLGFGEHITLTVNPLPDQNTITDYIACSDIANQFTFDLTTKDAEAINGQANVTVTYHESQAEAIANTGAITSPYTTFSRTIFVRAENTITGCVSTDMDFELIINENPVAIMPTPLQLCDETPFDGFFPIDLSVKNDEIVGTQTGMAIKYYVSQADADSDTNELAIPYTNISNPQTIYARVENNITGCFATTNFTVTINETPNANSLTPLEYCDTDNDGFGIFDIRSTESQVTGGAVSGVTVSYHETSENAENGVSPLPDTYSNINPYNQTIYVRVENGCFNVVPLVLIVHDSPE
ncbi:choice-of-anchor L domain-containing protein, partial [Kordia sp.]|uniref:choice-of-anchor L domain-containing protein n=1 Tax=Kordia sp. TaxID=1965332 RepID=UPI003D6A9FCA